MFKYLFKLISIPLSLIILLSAIFVCGTVSAETAIPISTKADFNNIRKDLSGNYYLTCDIEFEESDFSLGGAYYNSGKCFVPIGNGKTPFKGTFDGRGYTISGVKIYVSGNVYNMTVTPVSTGIATLSDDWTGDYIIPSTPTPTVSPAVGVFGSNNGTIKNVNISDCNITARCSNKATLYVGGVAGHNNGDILNCSVNNILNCNSYSYIGGITGYQSGGNIKNCSVFGTLKSDGVFGSVAGAIAGGSATECYTDVCFTGVSFANFALVGADVQDNIKNCYYIAESDLNGVGKRISTINAKDPKQYENFDFGTTWYMSGTLRRPALKIQNLASGEDVTAGDLNNDKSVNLADLVLIAQYVAKWDIEVYTNVANVDYNFTENGDDMINLQDVNYLAKHLAGWQDAVLY